MDRQLIRYQPSVTLVTALAATQDISDDEYRNIYARVAAGRSLRNIELALRSAVSYGWWAKYAAGERTLDRDRKNELRRWARENGGPDLPDLPPSPVEAVAQLAHPDAAVWHIGQMVASRIICVGADVGQADLRINGACKLLSSAPALQSPARRCTARYRRKKTKAIRISPETFERLNSARKQAGLTWDEFLSRSKL